MTEASIVIVDYGVGNTKSVANALSTLGYRKIKISKTDCDLLHADALILPGVGAFGKCRENLFDRRLIDPLNEAVLAKRIPILGICVGMQLMADESEENGRHLGLSWIPGRVVRLKLPKGHLVPHVGWNDVRPLQPTGLFSNISTNAHFYFDHSFHYVCDHKFVSAQCHYGTPIIAAIQRDNIYGVQFHPEKSHNNGLRIFRRFLAMVHEC